MARKSTQVKLAALAVATSFAFSPLYAAECAVKIGAVGPLSGASAAWGLSAQEAANFIAALTNEKGGLQVGDQKCKVSVYAFDAQYTAAGGAAAANYLASEKVHVTLGPVGSPETTGFREVAKRAGILNFSSSFMRDVITPDFPYSFHAVQAPVTFGPILVKAASEKLGFKSVVIVGANDQGGTDGTRVLKGLYEDAGIPSREEYYQRGTSNFAAIATRVMGMNPEALDVATMPPADATILIRQLLEAGYEGAIGALGGAGFAPIEEGSGGVENVKSAYWLETSPIDDPGIVKIKDEYRRLMGKEPPINPLFACYTLAAEVILQGISAAGTDSDPEKLATALRELTPESQFMGKHGWSGKRLYGINQALSFPIGMGLVVDGVKLPTETIQIPSES